VAGKMVSFNLKKRADAGECTGPQGVAARLPVAPQIDDINVIWFGSAGKGGD
jgi:hypothetical protein